MWIWCLLFGVPVEGRTTWFPSFCSDNAGSLVFVVTMGIFDSGNNVVIETSGYQSHALSVAEGDFQTCKIAGVLIWF